MAENNQGDGQERAPRPQAEQPPAAAKPRSGPGATFRAAVAFVKRHGLLASGAVIITIVTPFLVVSESVVKKYVEGWVNDCVLVFDISQVRDNRLLVEGFAQGRAPSVVPLTFAARGAEINSVRFVNHVDLVNDDRFETLAVHPQANLACPGQLCEELGNMPSAVNVTVALSDVQPAFSYPFHVDFTGKVAPANLRIYVQYNSGLEGGVCRVERANAFNLFVRLSKLGQFGIAVLAFVLLTILLAAVRALMKKEGGT